MTLVDGQHIRQSFYKACNELNSDSEILAALQTVCLFVSHLQLMDLNVLGLPIPSTATLLPSYLGSLKIFQSFPGSRLVFFRDASSVLLHLVNFWLSFTYSRSHAFRYGRKNDENPDFVKNQTHDSALVICKVTTFPLGRRSVETVTKKIVLTPISFRCFRVIQPGKNFVAIWIPVALSSGFVTRMRLVDLAFLGTRTGLTFDRPMTDSLCPRSFFSQLRGQYIKFVN